MSAAAPQLLDGNDSDSDDSDVAFAYMDFGGVDFGDDDEEAMGESKCSNPDVPTKQDVAAANAAANAPAVVERVANLDVNASESDATNIARHDLPTAS
eukprot:scaffold17011_cov175-Skeletonema_menzelii.AAC.2